jgi:hypothetical protein
MLERDRREPFEATYSLDALSNMHEAERRHGVRRWFQEPPGARTTAATGITFKKRQTLVIWLNELCAEFKFSSRTFEMAVQCLDDYVYHRRAQIALSRYQCLGTACVRLAAKMQEPDNGSCPSADEYAYMTEYTASCKEICAVEYALVTSTAPRSLTVPTPHSFLLHYRSLASCRAWDQSEETRTKADALSSYYCELSSLVPDMLAADHDAVSTGFLPSTIAAASLVIARATLDMPPWCFDLQRISGVDALDHHAIHECAKKLVDFQNAILDSTSLRSDSIFLKYEEVSFLRPARVSSPPSRAVRCFAPNK